MGRALLHYTGVPGMSMCRRRRSVSRGAMATASSPHRAAVRSVVPEVLLDQFSGRVLRLLLGSSPTGTGLDEAMSSPHSPPRGGRRRHPSRSGHPLACAGMTGEESGDGDRLTRRELVRRAAKVGAVVWTAPLIIDSLASPAAAATCPPGTTTSSTRGLSAVMSPASGTGCTGLGHEPPDRGPGRVHRRPHRHGRSHHPRAPAPPATSIPSSWPSAPGAAVASPPSMPTCIDVARRPTPIAPARRASRRRHSGVAPLGSPPVRWVQAR